MSCSTEAGTRCWAPNGDFSRLLDQAFTGNSRSGTVVGTDALGRHIVFGQIYDPATSRQLPDGTWIRDPFLGNIIPTSSDHSGMRRRAGSPQRAVSQIERATRACLPRRSETGSTR